MTCAALFKDPLSFPPGPPGVRRELKLTRPNPKAVATTAARNSPIFNIFLAGII
jgi:hypothetical protein